MYNNYAVWFCLSLVPRPFHPSVCRLQYALGTRLVLPCSCCEWEGSNQESFACIRILDTRKQSSLFHLHRLDRAKNMNGLNSSLSRLVIDECRVYRCV